jgi:hypothetical protein
MNSNRLKHLERNVYRGLGFFVSASIGALVTTVSQFPPGYPIVTAVTMGLVLVSSIVLAYPLVHFEPEDDKKIEEKITEIDSRVKKIEEAVVEEDEAQSTTSPSNEGQAVSSDICDSHADDIRSLTPNAEGLSTLPTVVAARRVGWMSEKSTSSRSGSSGDEQELVNASPRTVIATVVLEHPPERVGEHELSDDQLRQQIREYIRSEGIRDDGIEVHHSRLEEIDTGSLPTPADKIEVVDVVRGGGSRRTWLVDRTALDGETVKERLEREYDENEIRLYREGTLDQPSSRLRRDGIAVLTG